VIYSATLLDHFRNPRNSGLMRDPDAVGEGEYEGCGDLARVYLRIRDGHAAEIRVQTYGCGPTIAAASAGSELAIGRPLSDLAHLEAREVETALDGLPDERKHAADVVAAAIRAAARQFIAVRGAAEGEPSEKNPDQEPTGTAEPGTAEPRQQLIPSRAMAVRGEPEASRADESENHPEHRNPGSRAEPSRAGRSETGRSAPAPHV
jgi:nitrogen fixation NifU-like protein